MHPFNVIAAAGLAGAAVIEHRQASSTTAAPSSASAAAAAQTSSVPAYFLSNPPQYFQTTPELFAGPTPTGPAAFLAQSNPAPFPGVSYVAPQPLETQVPIVGAEGRSIYQMHGQLSHYFPNPDGFGVDEYHLPAGTNISRLFMLSRHGARYPTGDFTLTGKLQNNTGRFNATGQLSFLNSWKSQLGQQILTPIGKQELFDSGALHQYLYGHLYPNNGSKILVRTETQDRMIQSAEYFLAGFFGLHWPDNATIEAIIEQNGFNNSMAGYYDCPNSNTGVSAGGTNASTNWQNIYLADATARLNKMITGLNFTVSDVYSMQSLCAYETVALGYSAFCPLFTYNEWEGYEYSVDLSFAGNNAFQSPTGRGVGIGWVQEFLARLTHHYITGPTYNVNYTLDSNSSVFPLDQALNFDFSHDTNIMSILTAFGLKQFAPLLPQDRIPSNRSLIVSHLTPFGARLDIEILQAPHPVNPQRNPRASRGVYGQNFWYGWDPSSDTSVYLNGSTTQYVHFILNQRTLPLGASYPQCGQRDDGWCELGAFLNATSNLGAESQFDYACFGNYSAVGYGNITNGVPLPRNRTAAPAPSYRM